jgi:hypothetical protein
VLVKTPFSNTQRVYVDDDPHEGPILLIRNVFMEQQESMKGNFWLSLTNEAAHQIQTACAEMLESPDK